MKTPVCIILAIFLTASACSDKRSNNHNNPPAPAFDSSAVPDSGHINGYAPPNDSADISTHRKP